jgi:hypothetical protein
LFIPSGQRISDYEIFDVLNSKYLNFTLYIAIFELNRFKEKMMNLKDSKCNVYTRETNLNEQYNFESSKF